MSSVLIKGISMPENCEECPCYRADSMNGVHAYQCNITFKVSNWGLTERPSDCPLVEVKTPHGDLIDRDELFIPAMSSSYDNEMISDILNEAPTVIEAEGET